ARRFPETLKGAPRAGRAGESRQAPAGPGANRPGPAGREAAARDREIRRHLAPGLHRALRHLQRPPRRAERQAALLGLHRHQDRPQYRESVESQPGRQGDHALAASRHEVERRRAFTADDFVFWYQDMYLNDELIPVPLTVMTINGAPITLEKVDATTIRFFSPEPYHALPIVLSPSV